MREIKSSVGILAYAGPLFGWLPRYGGDLANAPALLDFGERASFAAHDSLALGQALNGTTGTASPVPIGVAALEVARTQGPLIAGAQASLAATARVRTRIDGAQLTPTLQDALYQFDQVLPVWKAGLDVLANAPTLLGADRPRTYLLVAQNSDELRASGGFVTGVAQVRVDQGRITVGEFQDSYAVDDLTQPHPSPPDALVQYMSAEQLLFRDGNWSPDFPTTARQLEDLYRIDQKIEADGVIAINQRAIPGFVEAFGSIAIDNPNENVDSNNVMPKIYQYWAPPPGDNPPSDWWEHHKDFLGKVFQAMMPRLMTGDFKQTVFARTFARSVASKDILIYLNDLNPGEATSLLRGGTLYQGTDDALMIVDSNVGFNKVDPNIARQAAYAVTLDSAGSARATITITYTNQSPATSADCIHQPRYLPTYVEMQQGCYWDYVRVVVPAKSQLQSADSKLQPQTEDVNPGRTALGGYFVLRAGETRTVRFEYNLPLGNPADYVLHLEKQPGAPAFPLSVSVTLPGGWRVKSASPAPARAMNNTLEFVTTLDHDQDIRVSIDRGLSPLAVASGLVGLGLLGGIAFWRSRRRKKVE